MNSIRNTVPASLRRGTDATFPDATTQGPTPKPQRRSAGADRPVPPPRRGSPQGLFASQSPFSPMPQEPDDARITGVTRSLNRRLLALNVPGSLRRRPAITPGRRTSRAPGRD